jgi:hypothetical protein
MLNASIIPVLAGSARSIKAQPAKANFLYGILSDK